MPPGWRRGAEIIRILLAFGTFVVTALAVTDLAAGNTAFGLGLAALAAALGFLLWRNLNDPEVTRRAGERGKVTFNLERGAGLTASGTNARLETHKKAWEVVLDRAPEGTDFSIYGHAQSAWVWMDKTGQPERIRLTLSHTIQRWNVLEATALAPSEGPK